MQAHTYPVTTITQRFSRALVYGYRGITLEEFVWSKKNIILQLISLLGTDGKYEGHRENVWAIAPPQRFIFSIHLGNIDSSWWARPLLSRYVLIFILQPLLFLSIRDRTWVWMRKYPRCASNNLTSWRKSVLFQKPW